MKEENDIDQLFKENLGARKFELKSSYLADLELKLDLQKKKKNRRVILFFIFLFPIGCYFLYSAFNKHDLILQKEHVIASKTIVESTHQDKEIIEELNDDTVLKENLQSLNGINKTEKINKANDSLSISREVLTKNTTNKQFGKTGPFQALAILAEAIEQEEFKTSLENEIKVAKSIDNRHDAQNIMQKLAEDDLSNAAFGVNEAALGLDSDSNNVHIDSVISEKFTQNITDTISYVSKAELMEEKPVKKWSAGIVFSPDYVFKTTSFDLPSNYNRFSKYSYTTGLNLVYDLNTRLSMELGVQYSSKSELLVAEEVDTNQIISSPPDPGSFVTVSTSNPPILYFSQRKIEIWSSYSYLEIPLTVDYYLTNKKIRTFISGGVSTNFLLKRKIITTVEYDDGRELELIQKGSLEDLSRVLFTMNFGLGVDYQLSINSYFRIAPVFRRSINSVNQNTDDKEYFNSIGCNIGFFYKW